MAQLQDVDSNLNSNFTGRIDVSQDLYAYIDESGDEGFDLQKNGVSQWFNVSAIIATPQVITNMVTYIRDYRDSKKLNKDLAKMSSKDLGHNQRKDLFNGLSKFNFITIHSLFYKPGIDPENILVTYPSMYFVGVKNILERLTWCAKQCDKRRVHITISNRNKIEPENLKDYLFKISFLANNNNAYLNKIGVVTLRNFNLKHQLLLADYSAFSLRMAFEEMGNPPCPEPQYFDWFQKGKLYSSTYGSYTGVWRNGLKLVPSDQELLKSHISVLDEGSQKL